MALIPLNSRAHAGNFRAIFVRLVISFFTQILHCSHMDLVFMIVEIVLLVNYSTPMARDSLVFL